MLPHCHPHLTTSQPHNIVFMHMKCSLSKSLCHLASYAVSCIALPCMHTCLHAGLAYIPSLPGHPGSFSTKVASLFYLLSLLSAVCCPRILSSALLSCIYGLVDSLLSLLACVALHWPPLPCLLSFSSFSCRFYVLFSICLPLSDRLLHFTARHRHNPSAYSGYPPLSTSPLALYAYL